MSQIRLYKLYTFLFKYKFISKHINYQIKKNMLLDLKSNFLKYYTNIVLEIIKKLRCSSFKFKFWNLIILLSK